jgi:hypothetical protein
MFKPRESSQSEYEFVSIDELVKLSEASQTQKSCMGFATAGYGD